MNKIQKISLIAGIVFSILWILSAYENRFELFDPYEWETAFDECYLMLLFALAVGSLLSFYLFKDNLITYRKSF